jgi:hypothetical protein
VQFATLTARSRIPATYSGREFVEVGGLMSYGRTHTHLTKKSLHDGVAKLRYVFSI